MEIINEKRFLKILLILGTVFLTSMFFNTITFAASGATIEAYYNSSKRITGTTYNLSMTYAISGIKWVIHSYQPGTGITPKVNSNWYIKPVEYNANIISIEENHSIPSYIIIKPKKVGTTTLVIRNYGGAKNTYTIKVTPFVVKYSTPQKEPLYLSVKYNGKEQKRDTPLNLSMKYENNPIQWNITSSTDWEVFSRDNGVISISETNNSKSKGYIKIKPLKGGQATITISTKDHKINYNYIIRVPYLSVKYNGKEQKRDTFLNLSMKYANVPIVWDIRSHTAWKFECKNTDVIEIQQILFNKDDPRYGFIKIKPKSCIANNGIAKIKIYTTDGIVNYYYIQVKTTSTLSVVNNRNNQEVPEYRLKLLRLSVNKYYTWRISSNTSWKVIYSKDNNAIIVDESRIKDGIIKITGKSYTANGGQATIIIKTNNNEIIKTYKIQVQADLKSSPSHLAPRNLIIRPDAEVDYTYKGKINTTPMPTVFIKCEKKNGVEHIWTVGSKVGGVGEWTSFCRNPDIIKVSRKKIQTNQLTIKPLKQRRSNYSFHR